MRAWHVYIVTFPTNYTDLLESERFPPFPYYIAYKTLQKIDRNNSDYPSGHNVNCLVESYRIRKFDSLFLTFSNVIGLDTKGCILS
jgi:hypothetical protein